MHLTPPEILAHLALIKAPEKLPKVIRDLPLPALELRAGGAASKDVVEGLLRYLSVSEGRGYRREDLLSVFEPYSAGTLALQAFAAWETTGFNGRHGWLLELMVALGDDRLALALEPHIIAWQHEGDTGRKRAIRTIPLLEALGTPTALMVLVGLTHTQDVPSVHDEAVRVLVAAARKAGKTHQQLSDEVIPDCGLDERGTRRFDLGGRALTLVLDQEFEPRLRDPERTLYEAIPQGAPGDDPEKVKRAVQEWELMQRRLHEVIVIQTRRMQEAMITGRSWRGERWEEVILAHPLMINFARRLVWGIYDEAGGLITSFRATEDATLVDVHDEEVLLTPRSQVRIVHPASLRRAERQAWVDSLVDYEIFAPFDQLDHEVCLPEARRGTAMTPDEDKRFTSLALREVMKREGWRRDTAGGYVRRYFYKRFEEDTLTGYVDLEPGLTAGGERSDPPQQIKALRFTGSKRGQKSGVPLEQVPDYCVSELLRFVSLVEQEQRRQR